MAIGVSAYGHEQLRGGGERAVEQAPSVSA